MSFSFMHIALFLHFLKPDTTLTRFMPYKQQQKADVLCIILFQMEESVMRMLRIIIVIWPLRCMVTVKVEFMYS